MKQDKHIVMRGVRKVYRFFSLDDVSLELEPGQIMGFVGPNGAGKSTTLRLAMGMIAPDAGEIRVLGEYVGLFGNANLNASGAAGGGR